MASITKMGKDFVADGVFTKNEALEIANKAKANGSVSTSEKTEIKKLLTNYKDQFETGAAEILTAVVNGTALPTDPGTPTGPTDPTGPGTTTPTDPGALTGQTVTLSEGGSARPLFVSATGSFVTVENASEPRDAVELGDGIFRAAELVDDAKTNPFANLTPDHRAKVLANLEKAITQPPAGLADAQAKQLRASCATTLLALAEASNGEAQKKALDTYVSLARAESYTPLRESMIFNLHASKASRSGAIKLVADELMRELAPLYPPYEKWFANDNKTVNMEWTVGEGQFWKGFTNKLKASGFTAVGAENEYGVTTYEKTVNRPGVGETTFRLTVRQGGRNMMAPAGKSGVQIFGYDGHSDWGRSISAAVRNAPASESGGDGQLFFYNMCVGKSGLDAVEQKFPNMQVVTTYAASSFYTDNDGLMTNGEGIQALLALVDRIADRSPWTKIHKSMNAAANLNWTRTWDNYVTPISTMTREKVLDRDNDGQADYLDKLYNFNTFRVAEDTRREFTPVQQERHAKVLDGTKVLMAGNMINTISEFSSILDRVNKDSKVVPGGWFEPKDADTAIFKFDKARNAEGQTEFHMKVNARYAHASEDTLRAMAIYEFNRYLAATGQLKLNQVDAKINGLILACHSMNVDEGWRERELWGAFLTKYNLPQVDFGAISSILDAEHSDYAGSVATIAKVRKALPQAALDALKNLNAGEPS